MADNTLGSKPMTDQANAAAAAARNNMQGAAADAVRRSTTAMEESGRAASDALRRGTEIGAEATQRTGQAGADAVNRAGSATSETLRRGTQAVAESQRQLAQDAAQRFEEVSGKLAQSVKGTVENMRAFMTLPNAADEGLRDIQQSMTGFVEGVIQTNLRATQELLRLSDPAAILELQQRFMREYMDVLMEGSATLVRAARKTADQSLRPLEQQIEQRQRAPHQNAAE